MEIKEFIKLEDEIKQILINDPRTRNDDMLLYATYCLTKTSEVIDQVGAFWICFVDGRVRKSYNIAPYGTVERCRRKIQAQCQELASERVKKARAKKEEKFKEYAKF